MNTTTLSKNFFFGGNATFTVDNGKGNHYTFKIRQPKGENKPFFASLLTGPNNESDYTYLGIVNETPVMKRVEIDADTFTMIDSGKKVAFLKLTQKSKMQDDSLPVRVLRFALRCAWGQQTLPEGYQIRHEGKCGCCGRTLTTPESLERGIGPECWSKMNGF